MANIHEKIASLFLSGLKRLDSAQEEAGQDSALLWFEQHFQKLMETAEHDVLLKAICRNARTDFHLQTYRMLVSKMFKMLMDAKKVSHDDIVFNCPTYLL
jgi:hypothetical protein